MPPWVGISFSSLTDFFPWNSPLIPHCSVHPPSVHLWGSDWERTCYTSPRNSGPQFLMNHLKQLEHLWGIWNKVTQVPPEYPGILGFRALNLNLDSVLLPFWRRPTKTHLFTFHLSAPYCLHFASYSLDMKQLRQLAWAPWNSLEPWV